MVKQIRVLFVFLIALAVYVAYNGFLAITDPVEANYALTAKEMVLSGNWLSPQIYGQYWFDKPIMIYWLLAASFKLLGFGEFAVRLPAAIFSAATVAFAYWFSWALYGNRKTARLSALILGTSLEFWLLSRMVITDAVLMFFNSVALGTLYLGFINRGTRWYVVAYAASGLAVLTKGPVGLVLPGLIVLSFIIGMRRWQLLQKLFIVRGLIVFSLVAVPWYYAMYKVHGQVFIDTFLGLHNYLRATVSEHPADNVFYYYLVLFPISVLPWAGILFRMFAGSAWEYRGRHFAYLTFWAAVTIVFYSLMATKYPTYVFPAIFPVALLMSNFIVHIKGLPGRNIWLWLSVPLLILIAIFMSLPKFLPGFMDLPVLWIIGGFFTILLLWLQFKGNPHRLPEYAALVVIVLSLVAIRNGFIPLADSRSAKTIAAYLPAEKTLQLVSYGDYSTSAVFYSGHSIPKLVHDMTEKPTGVWAGKYTMPAETVDHFLTRTAEQQNVFVLVDNDAQQLFLQESWATQFTPVATQRASTLYCRIVP